VKTNPYDKMLDELRSRFGNGLEPVSPQGKRFNIDEDQAVFLLKGSVDLFCAKQAENGEMGFSIPLFPRMEAGTLIPPMVKTPGVRCYGRCLPDSALVFLPWKNVEACGIDRDPWLWNALLAFAVAAHWELLPTDAQTLTAKIADWCAGSAKKLDFVNLQTTELIKNNRAERQRQHKHIFSAFSALMQFRKDKTAVCSQDDPFAAAATLTAEKNGIDQFTLVKGRNLEHRMERSAESNRLRITPAYLGDQWYKEYFHPMMLVAQDDSTAYCAYHSSHGDPVAWDGKTGVLYSIDRDFCATIDPAGWNFVIPFPSTPVTGKKIFQFFRRIIQKSFLWVIVLVAVATLLNMFVPIINSMIFSDVIPNSDRTLLGQLFFLLLVTSFAKVLLDFIARKLLWTANNVAEYSLQMALFDHLMRLPVNFFRNDSPADVGMKALGLQNLFTSLNTNCYLSIINLCFVIFPVGMLFYYSAKMAVALLLILFLFIGTALLLSAQIARLQYKILVQDGENNGILERFLANIGKLHAAGAENHALLTWIRKFSGKQKIQVQSQFCMMTIHVCFVVLNWLIFCAGMAVILWMYLHDSADERISVSDFSGFISATGIVSGTLMSVLGSVSGLLQIGPIFKWLAPLLEASEEEQPEQLEYGANEEEDENAEDDIQGGIELINVSFSYDGNRQILKNISLKADPGEFIAITGESGAGKSTLLRLMLRFEKPTSGTILFDGNDVDTKNISHIRSRLGVVLQNASLLPISILNNIVGSTSRYTEEDAWKAAEMAGCAEDIRQFPMQMQTFVTGNTISGGQLQRILLAHALIRNPRLIFLDEATSALDNRTQQIVIESLRKIKATKVVIAHRLSTIIDADRIYVLSNGSVAESGTYQELMQKNGIFSKMAARQLIEQSGGQA